MTTAKVAADITRLTVIGAGTMGNGIAHVSAVCGIEAVLCDLDQGRLDAAMGRIRSNLDKGVARDKISQADADAAFARVSTQTDLSAAVAEADIVVEAVPEILSLKQELFGKLSAAAPAGAVLATNTSSLPIAAIASAADRAERVVGMHFFNPVHIMKLVEVVRHDAASDDVVTLAVELSRRFGKTPIVVKDSPGFASSRLGLVLGLEAIRMVEAGVASAADIDTAMKLGYGHPMGPLELTDLVGLDVRLGIADYLAESVGEHFRPPQLLRDKVDAGKLGKKSGEGFYRWHDGKRVD